MYDVFLLVRNDVESAMLSANITKTWTTEIKTNHWSDHLNATYTHTEYFNHTKYMTSHDAICDEIIQRGYSCGIGDWGTGQMVYRRDGIGGTTIFLIL